MGEIGKLAARSAALTAAHVLDLVAGLLEIQADALHELVGRG